MAPRKNCLRNVRARLLAGAAVFGASFACCADDAREAFRAVDLGDVAPIEIDGFLDDAWSSVPVKSDFTEYYPRLHAAAAARTEVRVARDGRFLFVFAQMFDPDISKLRSGYVRRDGFLDEQDWFEIIIDPLGTRRMGQGLFVNPQGVIRDGLVNDEAGTFNDAPDFEIEVATQIHNNSWAVEMRIPFTQLRYDTPGGERWNVLVRRNMPRRERWAMSSPSIGGAPCLVCFAAPLEGLGTLPMPHSFELVPQILVESQDGYGGDAESAGRHTSIEPSLDAKFRLGPSTVLDATLNPDFSQLELDTPQLSSNRQFALSLPEKRPFFLEGLDILDSPLTAIYTRSIGNPAWGLRATHRGQWDGVLITATDKGGGEVILPGPLNTSSAPRDLSSQATIGRLRLPLESLTLGMLITDRRSGDGQNTVLGPDIVWFPSRETRIRAQWLTSRTTGVGSLPAASGDDSTNGQALSIGVLEETRHWRSELEYEQLDDEFRADDGFIPQVGVRKLAGAVQYNFLDLPMTSKLAPYVGADWRENFEGQLVSEASRLGFQAHFARNSILTAELRPQQSARLRTGEPMRSAHQQVIAISSSPIARVASLGLVATLGQTLDVTTDQVASGETISASALIRPFPAWEIEPRIDISELRTDVDETAPMQVASERAMQVRTSVQLSARNRLRLIVQSTAVNRQDRATGVRLVDQSRLAGSFLFTHERSLLSRVYAGVSFSEADDSETAPVRDDLEVFLKVQAAVSPGKGFLW